LEEESDTDVELIHCRKRRIVGSSSDGAGPSGLSCFDPPALVKSSEGTFKAPKIIQEYLDKHFKRCASKEEREALFKEHPRLDPE
jgi:hypothetical protein